jgi:hypothetical protein
MGPQTTALLSTEAESDLDSRDWLPVEQGFAIKSGRHCRIHCSSQMDGGPFAVKRAMPKTR